MHEKIWSDWDKNLQISCCTLSQQGKVFIAIACENVAILRFEPITFHYREKFSLLHVLHVKNVAILGFEPMTFIFYFVSSIKNMIAYLTFSEFKLHGLDNALIHWLGE